MLAGERMSTLFPADEGGEWRGHFKVRGALQLMQKLGGAGKTGVGFFGLAVEFGDAGALKFAGGRRAGVGQSRD